MAELKFTSEGDGLRFQRGDTIARTTQSPPSTGADHSLVQNLRISGSGGTTGSGLLLRCRVRVEGCFVSDFGRHGIEILATAREGTARQRKGNANGWSIIDTSIYGSGSHGLFIEGADTNAGYSLRLNSSSNGGYGVYDSSFLGNTHIAAHAANNEGGAYFSDGKNARSVFIGCYAEEPQRSVVMAPSMVIGGLSGANDGSGQVIRDGRLTPFEVQGSVGEQQVRTAVGWAGRPLTMIAEGDHPSGWGFTWSERTGNWTLRHAGLDRGTVFQLTTKLTNGENASTPLLLDSDTPVPAGQMLLPKFLVRKPRSRFYEEFNGGEVLARLRALEAEVERLAAQ